MPLGFNGSFIFTKSHILKRPSWAAVAELGPAHLGLGWAKISSPSPGPGYGTALASRTGRATIELG